MSRHPAGPKIKHLGTAVPNVPLPLLLTLVFAVNALTLLFSIIFFMATHPMNLFKEFSQIEENLLTIFGVVLSMGVVWSLATNRAISRYLILANTLGVSLLWATLYFGEERAHYPSIAAVVCVLFLPTIYVLFFSDHVTKYYSVLRGETDPGDYSPYSVKASLRLLSLGEAISVFAEIVIVIIAFLVIAVIGVSDRSSLFP